MDVINDDEDEYENNVDDVDDDDLSETILLIFVVTASTLVALIFLGALIRFIISRIRADRDPARAPLSTSMIDHMYPNRGCCNL